MANLSFDARSVEPDQGRIGAIPAGWYPVLIDETEVKPTSQGDGAYLNVRFSVLDGAYKNSKLWHRFNTKNQSEKAVEIAYKQLSALMHAVKVLAMQQTEQLHNIPLFVKIKVEPAVLEADGVTVKYEAKNEIQAFREVTDPAARAAFALQSGAPAAAPKAPPPPAQATPAAPAGGGWTAPAAAQPWGNAQAAAPAPNAVQAVATQAAPVAQVQAAPVQQTAVTATDPVTSTQSQTSAPASAVAQQAAPSWANAPAAQTAAPAQTTTAAPAQASTVAQPSGEVLPPWMQQPS